MTVDSRLFTTAGRAEIKKEQSEVGQNIQKVGEITGDAISKGVAGATSIVYADPKKAAKKAYSIEKVLNFVGIPTTGNSGLYGEPVILLGADDLQQKPYLIVGKDSPKYDKNLFMPIEEMPGYDDLPQQSKDQAAGLYISKQSVTIDKNTATYQNSTNGMLNTKVEGMVNALQQTFGSNQTKASNGNVEFTLNFNQSKGAIADGLEAVVDIFAGTEFFGFRPFSWFNTGASDAAGQTVQDVVNNTDRANFAQHSQGNPLINAALPGITINKTPSQLVNPDGSYNYTYTAYGSPVNNQNLNNGLGKLGIQFYSSVSNTNDSVSEFGGGNFGLYHVQYQPKIEESTRWFVSPTRAAGALNLPEFFNDKYAVKIDPVSKQQIPQQVSAHSSYECVANCGLDGRVQPTLPAIQQSMGSAKNANIQFKTDKPTWDLTHHSDGTLKVPKTPIVPTIGEIL